MKRRQLFASIVAAVIALGASVQPIQAEIGISINVGDRPYYEGPTYWDSGYEWIWVPGYDHRHHWVHGHYEKRGGFHREHAHEHH
ncbi:MAG TPA: hypothetical protein VGF73_00325, partial [Chthoniobacterales bacterium]